CVCLLLIGPTVKAAHEIHTIQVHQHPLSLVSWEMMADSEKPVIVLLSGPIDSWHSDSAWWAALGPALARDYQVLAIDRAGINTDYLEAPVGYRHFAEDLQQVFTHFEIQNAMLIAFASSNISLQLYLHRYPKEQAIRKVLMIDPDVLTEFSITRYSEDAQPFKDNLVDYLAYIDAGKYTERMVQKNTIDRGLLETLALKDADIDWGLVDKMFDGRLKINNQRNLFREIAGYSEDLKAAVNLPWPEHIGLTIIDTDFELTYIEKTDDSALKAKLEAWRQDGQEYYKKLVQEANQGRYISVDSHAHLYQFADPNHVLEILRTLAR
ncbi:MAG: alpha/beta hydrolase, partial [Pseudomonadota bacterium]